MSGIAKPLVNCSTSTTPNQQIPVDKIVSMDKYILEDANDASKLQVGIRFTLDSTCPVRDIELKYPGDKAAAIVLRDASFAALKTLLSNTTV